MPSQRRNSPPVDPFPPLRRSTSSSLSPSVPSYASIAARSSHPHRDESVIAAGMEGEVGWSAEDIDRRDPLDELNPSSHPYAEPIDVDPSPPWRSRHRSSTAQPRTTEGEGLSVGTASADAGPSREPAIGTPSGTTSSRPNAAGVNTRNSTQRREGDGISTPTNPEPSRPVDRSPPSPSPTRPTRSVGEGHPRQAPRLTLEEMLSNIRPQSQQESRSSSSTTRVTGPMVRAALEDRRRQREAAVSNGNVPWGMERVLPSDASRTAAAMSDLAAMDLELLGEPVVVPFPRADDGGSNLASRIFNHTATRPLDGSAANQAITSFLRRRRRNAARAPGNTQMAYDPQEPFQNPEDFDDVATTPDSDDDAIEDERWGSRLRLHTSGDVDGEFDIDGPGLIRSSGVLHRGGYNRRRRSLLQRIGAPPDLRFPEPDEEIDFPPPVRGIADAAGCEPTNRALAATVAPLVVRSGGIRRTRDAERETKQGARSGILESRKRQRTNSAEGSGSHRPSYLAYSTLGCDVPLPSAFVPPIRRSHLALTIHKCSSLPPRPLVSFVGYNPTGQDADATALITTTPIPLAAGVHYYEVEVIDKGLEGFISVGWMREGTSLRRLVGWDKGAWGWHSDDGRSFEGQARGESFSETWTTKDVVGCGIDFTTGRAFFTKNGKMMGHRFKNLAGGLHPAIGLRSVGESLAINFTGPFKFDIDDYVKSTRDGIWKSVVKDREVGDVPRLVDQVPRAVIVDGKKSDQADKADNADGDEKMAEESLPTSVTTRTAPQTPMEKTLSAFVLDYLRHHGNQSTLSILQPGMASRGWIASPNSATLPDASKSMSSAEIRLSDFPSKSAALNYLHKTIAESFKTAIPWLLFGDLTTAIAVSATDSIEEIRHNLMIFDYLSFFHFSLSPSTTSSSTSIKDGSFDKLLEKGRHLRQVSKNENWSKTQLDILHEAFGLLVTPKSIDEEVWKKRRSEWADGAVRVLREVNGMKDISHLEQAIKQTRVVLRTLAEKDGKTGAAFVDPSRIVE